MWNVGDLEHGSLEVLKKGKPTLTPWLCEVLLSQASTMARMTAANVLRDLGDKRSVDPLLRAAEADPHEPTKWAATIAITRFADDPRVQAMFRQMAEQTADARRHKLALEALRPWQREGDAAANSVADLGALLGRCSSTGSNAQAAEYALESMLSLAAHELSDADLRAVFTFRVPTAPAHVVVGGPGTGHGVVSIDFAGARRLAGAELLHRWTLHPYWQWPWFKRFSYALSHGVPRRPAFSHNPLVAFGRSPK